MPGLARGRDVSNATARSAAFSAAALRIDEAPPAPLPRVLLHCLIALIAAVVLWLVLGELDIVAVAEGRLAPRANLKIVQPAEAGVVREIAVTEGQLVVAGEVLVRLEPNIAEAETRALQGELTLAALRLRRIDAELADMPLARRHGDADDTFARADAQLRANRTAYLDALAQEAAAVARTGQELRAATEVERKLARTVPIFQTMAERYAKLAGEGFVSELYALERERDRIEKEYDLSAQRHTAESLRAGLAQAERRLAQVGANYRQQLHAERAQIETQRVRLAEELAKQLHRAAAVELAAPQAGVVKDLATHTIGTVVSPGTVLLSLVPAGEELQADVMVRNADAGFVRVGQQAKVKLVTYPFQKYGLVAGTVVHVSPDAAETAPSRREGDTETAGPGTNGYRARIALASQSLAFDGGALPFASGMQVAAEIRLGERTLLEYLLAPVRQAWHEAARER